MLLFVFFLTDPAPTHIYTLSLHDALPICISSRINNRILRTCRTSIKYNVLSQTRISASIRIGGVISGTGMTYWITIRSEEHTSELQSRPHLVCRLLLEKKKKKHTRKA